MLADDAKAFLADMYEEIVYVPRSGPERPIRAIVTRNIPTQSETGAFMSAITITVENSDEAGIALSEVDGRGADCADVAPVYGQARKRYGVYIVGNGILGKQDAGMVTYELR